MGDSAVASPELALVDADLAAELRRGLRAAEDTRLRPRMSVDEAPAAIEEDAPPEPVVADELPLAELLEGEHLPDLDYIVEAVEEAPAPIEDLDYIVEPVEQAPARSQPTRSYYPALPEPEEGAIEETDAVLRRMREHMTEELPAPKRKLRRRFILASGASALCAVGVLALDVQLQVAQLPGWLGF